MKGGKKKGKRGIQETESPQLEAIAEETASDVAEVQQVQAPARKITRRQSAMEIATTIDHSKPTAAVSTRPKRGASRK
jgi:hypothetical protein